MHWIIEDIVEVVKNDLNRINKKKFVIYHYKVMPLPKNGVSLIFELKSRINADAALKLKNIVIVKHEANYEFVLFQKSRKGDWYGYRLVITKGYGREVSFIGRVSEDVIWEVLNDEL